MMRTFKNRRDAAKLFALALGVKGAKGGWLYRPATADLVLSGQDGPPPQWAGRQLYQGWSVFERNHERAFMQLADGRWCVIDARKLYTDLRERSSAAYAEYLDALAHAGPADENVIALKDRHEGWKVRVFAAHDLAGGGVA